VNITQDPIKGTVWAFTEKAVFRYKVNREERNVWQVCNVLEVKSTARSCEVRSHEIDC
jgi:Pep3/Vps18/deep orange family.